MSAQLTHLLKLSNHLISSVSKLDSTFGTEVSRPIPLFRPMILLVQVPWMLEPEPLLTWLRKDCGNTPLRSSCNIHRPFSHHVPHLLGAVDRIARPSPHCYASCFDLVRCLLDEHPIWFLLAEGG